MSQQQSFLHPTALRLAAVLAVLLALVVSTPVSAQDFGQPDAGRTVYDRADLLSSDEIALLEERAARVEDAGAPVIVYLRPEDADFDETLADARDLMDAWDVQSAPDARDGIVIFLNLDPDDLRHGQLALVAGAAHFDGGNLPQYELDRITERMRGILGDEETANGIATGLEMLATSLVEGPAPPPEPSAFESFSEDMTSGIFSPLNIVAIAVSGAVGLLTRRIWSDRPKSNVPATPTIVPPDDLIPAAAGALTVGNVSDGQLEATILDLARRSALAIEPQSDKKVRLRLLDENVPENPIEQAVWDSLHREADQEHVIANDQIAKVRTHWSEARAALRTTLVASGWFDPDASKRARPLYIGGALTLLAGIAAVILTVVSEEPWALLGTGLLAIIGFAAIIMGASMPHTTAEGDALAQRWRGYRQGLKDAREDWSTEFDLDVAVPYLVAMNEGTVIDERLKRASEAGLSPLWLGSSAHADWGVAGFYPYWIAFHSSVAPTTSGTTTGGASAGSGGSGGSF